MNQAELKEILLQLKKTSIDFSIKFIDEESNEYGIYNEETHEIILFTKNIETDNGLVITAIHEYAHHLTFCQTSIATDDVHTREFSDIRDNLLKIAGYKGLCKLPTDPFYFYILFVWFLYLIGFLALGTLYINGLRTRLL